MAYLQYKIPKQTKISADIFLRLKTSSDKISADSIVPKIGVKKLKIDTLLTGLYLKSVVQRLNAIDDKSARYKNKSIADVEVT